MVVAPGITWPQHDPEARQAVAASGPKNKASVIHRQTWLVEQYQGGKSMIVVGFDAIRLGRHEAFKGMRFASSPQARWSFGKKGAKFSDEAVLQSADRLYHRGQPFGTTTIAATPFETAISATRLSVLDRENICR